MQYNTVTVVQPDSTREVGVYNPYLNGQEEFDYHPIDNLLLTFEPENGYDLNNRRALTLEHYSKPIRCISLVDLFISLFNLISILKTWFAFYSVAFAVCSYLGYKGATEFKRKLLAWYLLATIVAICLEITLDIIYPPTGEGIILFILIYLIIKVLILVLVERFYHMLPYTQSSLNCLERILNCCHPINV